MKKELKKSGKGKKKLLKDIKLIDDALNGLDELEDFVKNFKYNILKYYNETIAFDSFSRI